MANQYPSFSSGKRVAANESTSKGRWPAQNSWCWLQIFEPSLVWAWRNSLGFQPWLGGNLSGISAWPWACLKKPEQSRPAIENEAKRSRWGPNVCSLKNLLRGQEIVRKPLKLLMLIRPAGVQTDEQVHGQAPALLPRPC